MSMRTAKATNASRPTYSFNNDTDTGVHSPGENQVSVVVGGAEQARFGTGFAKPTMTVELTATGAAASSGVFASHANPFGYAVMITQSLVRIGTQSTGASTLDIGVAANGTTSADNLIDGLSAAAAGVFDTRGTNGRPGQLWGATEFVNVAEASGDVAGAVLTVYLTVCRA